MANKEFNADLDNYIKRIRKKRMNKFYNNGGTARLKKSKSVLKDLNDKEVIIEEKEPLRFRQLIVSLFTRKPKLQDENESQDLEIYSVENTISTEDPDFEEEIEEEIEETEGFFEKLLSLFRKKEPVEEYDDEQEEPEDNDLKEVFKIITKWLNFLPPHKLNEFKKSEDFKKYKEFLLKHKLIKE